MCYLKMSNAFSPFGGRLERHRLRPANERDHAGNRRARPADVLVRMTITKTADQTTPLT